MGRSSTRQNKQQRRDQHRPNPHQISRTSRARHGGDFLDANEPVTMEQGVDLVIIHTARVHTEQRAGKAAGQEHTAQKRDTILRIADILGNPLPAAVRQPQLDLRMSEYVAVPMGFASKSRRAVNISIGFIEIDRRITGATGLPADVLDDHDRAAESCGIAILRQT